VIECKLAGSARPENEAELRWLRSKGVRAVVCLNMERPLDGEEVKALGFEYVFIPVRDFAAPRLEDIQKFVSFASEMLGQGKPVVVCCGAGIGRTGTMLAAYLVSLCWSPEEALMEVEDKRGLGVESDAQREAVYGFARQRGKC
jgi:protein-tyrosine phosphatase